MDFTKLSKSAKIYLGLCGVAFISLFMKWVDIGIASQNGFQQQGWIILIPLVYITVTKITGRMYNKWVNLALSMIIALLTIVFMFDKMVAIGDEVVNLASTGIYLMVICCLGFVIMSSIDLKKRNNK